MGKKQKFMAWLAGEIDNPVNSIIRDELELLLAKCDSDMWEIHVRQRDVDNRVELHILQNSGDKTHRPKALASRMVATTKAIRKIMELEAAQ